MITHPAVLDAAVIGVPDKEYGESVMAVLQLVEPETASETLAAELIDYCRGSLSSIKCPREIDFRKSLPRSATGKLYKRKLKDVYWL